MTGVDWPNLIIQLPIVAAFLWYSLELQKRYQISMDKRDDAYLAALAKITYAIDCHDNQVADRIAAARKDAEFLAQKAAEVAAQIVMADAALSRTQPRVRAK